MKIQVVSQVQIDITQEDMEEMVRAKINATDPNIIVDSIKFQPKQRPARIEVEVEAHYGKDTPVVETEEKTIVTEEVVEEDIKTEVVEESTEAPFEVNVEPQTEDDIDEELDLETLMQTSQTSVLDEIVDQSEESTEGDEPALTVASMFN